MSTIDQQFVEYIVKTLVNNPDKVVVDRKIDEKGVLLSLTVAPEDIGRVIGKRGNTAQALRTLLRALGTKNDARYNLKVLDVDGGRPSHATFGSDDSAIDEPAHAEPPEPEETAATEEVVEIEEELSDENASDTADDAIDDMTARAREDLADLDDSDEF